MDSEVQAFIGRLNNGLRQEQADPSCSVFTNCPICERAFNRARSALDHVNAKAYKCPKHAKVKAHAILSIADRRAMCRSVPASSSSSVPASSSSSVPAPSSSSVPGSFSSNLPHFPDGEVNRFVRFVSKLMMHCELESSKKAWCGTCCVVCNLYFAKASDARSHVFDLSRNGCRNHAEVKRLIEVSLSSPPPDQPDQAPPPPPATPDPRTARQDTFSGYGTFAIRNSSVAGAVSPPPRTRLEIAPYTISPFGDPRATFGISPATFGTPPTTMVPTLMPSLSRFPSTPPLSRRPSTPPLSRFPSTPPLSEPSSRPFNLPTTPHLFEPSSRQFNLPLTPHFGRMPWTPRASRLPSTPIANSFPGMPSTPRASRLPSTPIANSWQPLSLLPSTAQPSAFNPDDYLADSEFDTLLNSFAQYELEDELEGMLDAAVADVREKVACSAATQSEADKAVGMCIVCMDGPASHIIIPCGHQCICAGCEVRVNTCPVCRGARHQCIRVFASGIQTDTVESGVRKSKSKKEERGKAKKNKKEKKHKKDKVRKKDKKDKKAKKHKENVDIFSQVAPDLDVDDIPSADHLSESSAEKEEEDSDAMFWATALHDATSNEIGSQAASSSSRLPFSREGVFYVITGIIATLEVHELSQINISSVEAIVEEKFGMLDGEKREMVADLAAEMVAKKQHEAQTEAAVATEVDITLAAASSALTRDYESGCPVCKQGLGEVRWSGPKKTFTVKCNSAKQHTLDYFNNKWMPDKVRQKLLRTARATSAGLQRSQ